MPTVTKQVAHAVKKPKAGSLLSRVTPVAQVDSGGLHISLYGRAKTGKTRLISTFPKPVVIIGGEDGTRSIRNAKDVYFVRVIIDGTPEPEDGKFVTVSELPALVDELVDRNSGYATIAVDTASALQDLVLAKILGLSEIPTQKSWGMATREQYGQCGIQLKTVLRKLMDASWKNVVVTAHERSFNEDASDTDILFPTVGSALTPSVAGWLNGACEYICNTFIKEKTVAKNVTIAGKVKTVNEKVKGADYCLRVGPDPVYMTGFRVPLGSPDLPEYIVDPTYDKIMKLVNGK